MIDLWCVYRTGSGERRSEIGLSARFLSDRTEPRVNTSNVVDMNRDLSRRSSPLSCWTPAKAFLSRVTSSSAAQYFPVICSCLCCHVDNCSCNVSHLWRLDKHLSSFSCRLALNLLMINRGKQRKHTVRFSRKVWDISIKQPSLLDFLQHSVLKMAAFTTSSPCRTLLWSHLIVVKMCYSICCDEIWRLKMWISSGDYLWSCKCPAGETASTLENTWNSFVSFIYDLLLNMWGAGKWLNSKKSSKNLHILITQVDYSIFIYFADFFTKYLIS